MRKTILIITGAFMAIIITHAVCHTVVLYNDHAIKRQIKDLNYAVKSASDSAIYWKGEAENFQGLYYREMYKGEGKGG